MAEELATLPKPETPKAGRIGFEAALGIQQPYMQRKAELQPQITAAEGDIAKATQAQSEVLAGGKQQAAQGLFEAEKKAKEDYQKKLEAEPLPAFIPTKDSVNDIAGLFSVIGVLGMLVGGKGKMAGQRAMGAMNGMMEGYRKGRADLYKQERNEFDANFKTMLQKHQEFRKEMEDAVKLAATNKEAGYAAAELAATKAGSDIVKAQLRKGDLMGAYKLVDESQKGAESALKLEQKAREAEIAAAARKEEAAQRERRHREDMAQRERLAKLKTDKTVAGKPLTDKQTRDIEGLDSLAKGLEDLNKSFKPEFASLGVLGFGADMEFEARRRLGDKKGQEAVSWWSKYERLQAPNRHALFGATLTGNELKNYQSFTAKKSDSPETVRTLLEDQINYAKSTGENKKMVFEAAGYKVPEGKARDFVSTFSTQPSKYSIGQVIEQNNKKYKVVNISNPDDPELEEVK